MKHSIAVFCGSSSGNDPIYIEQAKRLGETLAKEKRQLVYGGAQVGCMGAVANAAKDNGGKVVGVIPKKLKTIEVAHHGLDELIVVETMHERKAEMAKRADAFVALPGGAGTLEEWFEVFTWSQLGYHDKPCAFLNINGFYEPLIQMIDHTIEQGFMNERYKKQMILSNTIEECLEKIDAYKKETINKWNT